MIRGGLFAPTGRSPEHEPLADAAVFGTAFHRRVIANGRCSPIGPDAVRAGRDRESRWGCYPPPASADPPSSHASTPFDALRGGPAASHPRLSEPFPRTNPPLTPSCRLRAPLAAPCGLQLDAPPCGGPPELVGQVSHVRPPVREDIDTNQGAFHRAVHLGLRRGGPSRRSSV